MSVSVVFAIGLSTTATVPGYVIYNFVYMSAALLADIVSDRLGRRGAFVLGLLVFAGVDGGEAAIGSALLVWRLFAVYGLYIAMTDGVGSRFTNSGTPVRR